MQAALKNSTDQNKVWVLWCILSPHMISSAIRLQCNPPDFTSHHPQLPGQRSFVSRGGIMNDGFSRWCSVAEVWQDSGESSISKCKSDNVAPPPHPSLFSRGGSDLGQG